MNASIILKAIAKDINNEDFHYVEIYDDTEANVKEQVEFLFGESLYVKPGEYVWTCPDRIDGLYSDFVVPIASSNCYAYLYRIED